MGVITHQQLYEAAQYVYNCLGGPYVIWYGGDVSSGDGPPAWGVNAPPPPASKVRREGAFCASVASLMHRYLGLKIPNPNQNEAYDGGIVSYWAAYYDASEWFDLNANYEDGTFVMSPYNSEAVGDQGHIAMVWHYDGIPYVMEWILNPGGTWDYTLAESNKWGNYKIAIRPSAWVPLAGGVFSAAEATDPIEPARPARVSFSVEHLLACMPNLSQKDAKAYFPHLLAACKEFDISTRERVSAFLAQVGHESGDLYYWEEIEGASQRYAPYYGRGPIQLTWQENYQSAGDSLGLDLVNNPGWVATPEVGFRTSGWFWRNGNGDLNPYADTATWESFDEITLRINGGWNGKADRDARYQTAWDALPEGLTLEEKEEPVTPVDPVTPVEPPQDEGYPYGWFGLDEHGYIKAVDVPEGSWFEPIKYSDGNVYLTMHTDPAWRKARERKSDLVEFREKGEQIQVRDASGSSYLYSREKFDEIYVVEKENE